MKVEYGTLQDIESWMELVKEVRWNFPGLETQEALEDHRQTVLRFMGENQALCVKDNGKIIGVLLFSKTHNMICCLAVDPAYRRNGIASALLEKALSELDRSKDITVTTFRENDEKGTAPRELYKRFGFAEGKLLVGFGYPVQEFVLRGK
ncbi:MAG: GNAT family N-acetyltransferase [Faecousia sp.]